MSSSDQLTDRVVVVTGASAGIGRATAQILLDEGCQVVAVARRAELLDKLAPREAQGGDLLPFAADLTDPASIESLKVMCENRFAHIDGLVNCAGGSRTLARDAADHEWMDAFELNFHSPRRLTHALLPQLERSPSGRVVNVTGSQEPGGYPLFSGAGGTSHMNAASAAKSAVHFWSKQLSREVADLGITVNCVSPGTILSEQIRRIFPDTDSRQTHVREHQIPMGRLGGADEVAHAIAFLVSPASSYITGEVLHVDGGKRRYAY
jgi:3-oxoacyl-[acyl-carrier protein] reductase